MGPAPNVGGPLSTAANNFLNTEGRPTNANQENARFDYVQSANSTWMFRYAHSGEAIYTPINIPQEGTNTNSQVHQGMLGHTWVIGPNKVNEFKFGISRLENIQATIHAGVEKCGLRAGHPGNRYQQPAVLGHSEREPRRWNLQLGENSDIPFNTWDTIIQVTDNFSWNAWQTRVQVRRRHQPDSLQRHQRTVTRGRFTETGQYTSSGQPGAPTVAANNVADFMLGLFSLTEGQVGEPLANLRNFYTGLYFQDSWKVTRN